MSLLQIAEQMKKYAEKHPFTLKVASERPGEPFTRKLPTSSGDVTVTFARMLIGDVASYQLWIGEEGEVFPFGEVVLIKDAILPKGTEIDIDSKTVRKYIQAG